MGELRGDHRAEVAGHRQGAGLQIDTRLPGGAVDDVARSELENLAENIDVVTRWLGGVSVCWL